MTNPENWAFGNFWESVNKELADIGEPECVWGEVRHYYDSMADYSPYATAHLIAAERKAKA